MCVCVCVCARACWHRRHLEISPSPFKWEVSGRAPRTVSVGNPDQQIESHREWLSEWEQRRALRLHNILRTAAVFRPRRSVFILPNIHHLHLHQQQRPGSLHFFVFVLQGPEQRSPRTQRAALCPQTAVLWMRWGIKAGEEEGGGRKFVFFSRGELRAHRDWWVKPWSVSTRYKCALCKKKNTFCPELLL